MKMEETELDLSKKKCHACGQPVWMDIANQTMRCVHYACKIKNVDFSIPVKFVDKKENK